MRARPSSWLSSPGGGWVVALARQCRQASRQAPVVSQNTSIGRWLKSTAGRGSSGCASAWCLIGAWAVIAALPLLASAATVTPASPAARPGSQGPWSPGDGPLGGAAGGVPGRELQQRVQDQPGPGLPGEFAPRRHDRGLGVDQGQVQVEPDRPGWFPGQRGLLKLDQEATRRVITLRDRARTAEWSPGRGERRAQRTRGGG